MSRQKREKRRPSIRARALGAIGLGSKRRVRRAEKRLALMIDELREINDWIDNPPHWTTKRRLAFLEDKMWDLQLIAEGGPVEEEDPQPADET
jgi:hypothetical protein